MIKKLIQEFLEHLEVEKNRSKMTVRNYNFYLKRFAAWAEEAGVTTPEKIDLDLVRKYRLWLNRLLVKNEELKKSTQNYHLIAVRSFLKYLAKRDIKSVSPEKIELGKMPDRQVEFLEGNDLERLLEAPLKAEGPEIVRKRDKAILEFLFSTGLRVSELTGLNREQVNLEKDEFTVRGKGSKLRIVFISNTARHWLKQYLSTRRDVSPALFVGHDKAAGSRDAGEKDEARLTPRSVQRLVKKYSLVAGITKKVTVHTLRHSFATDLLTNGADIRSVQTMLGHASLTTTQIYTHLTDRQLKQIHQNFHDRKREQT